MAFTQQTFLGATIVSCNISMGWNGSPSQLQVNLVNDPVNGDAFTPVSVGDPIYFQFYRTKFYGILQKWVATEDRQGNPAYEVTCSDPRELLDNTQLILSGYYGATNAVSNVLNVFGYWENNLGFGGSQANESGIPWRKVTQAVTALTVSPVYTTYGGPIRFKNYQYAVDLSELPTLPDYCRVGGGSTMSLMQYIQEVCELGGCDFFVKLNGYVIQIKTVSRYHQPPLGVLSQYISNSSVSGKVEAKSIGLELRNEETSSFLIGGPVQTLYKGSSISSFWGFDLFNNPILGYPGYLVFRNRNNQIIGYETTDFMTLNSSEVADILGYEYPTTEFELRLCLNNNNIALNVWKAYIDKFRRGDANNLPLLVPPPGVDPPPPIQNVNPVIRNNLRDNIAARITGGISISLQNPERDSRLIHRARLMPNNEAMVNNLLNDMASKISRVFNFLKRTAAEYFGRKFVVRLPFVLTKTDAETGVVSNSYDISDGGYVETVADNDLNNMPFANQLMFQTQDSRFTSFSYCQIGTLNTQNTATTQNRNITVYDVDLARVNPDSIAIWRNNLYQKTKVSNKICYVPEPAAIVTIDPIYLKANDFYGVGNTLLTVQNAGAVHAAEAAPLQNLLVNIVNSVLPPALSPAGTAGLSIHPNYKTPVNIHIPLRNNILTYGPWYGQGAYGKVKVEQDQSLTPWNYGGYTYMNLAGNAKVSAQITNMQTSEAGQISLAEEPLFSIGDILQANGPNITNINVSYSIGGVKTNYRFETFIPRFGQVGKTNVDLIKKSGLRMQSQIKQIKKNLLQAENTQDVLETTWRAYQGFRQNLTDNMQGASPHTVLFSQSMKSIDNDDRYCFVSTSKLDEALQFLPTGGYQDFAIANLSCLTRPFSVFGDRTENMAYMEMPSSNFSCITSRNYNPLYPNPTGNDIEPYTWNEVYPSSIHTTKEGVGTGENHSRIFGLRGPLVVVGWGRDLNNNIVPSGNDYTVRSDKWKVGPVDLLYDDTKKVWTSHDIVRGVVQNDVDREGYGEIKILSDTSTTTQQRLNIKNYSGRALKQDDVVVANYLSYESTWGITDSNNVTGSGSPIVPTITDGEVIGSSGISGIVWEPIAPGGTGVISVRTPAGSGQLTFVNPSLIYIQPGININVDLTNPAYSEPTFYYPNYLYNLGGVINGVTLEAITGRTNGAVRVYNRHTRFDIFSVDYGLNKVYNYMNTSVSARRRCFVTLNQNTGNWNIISTDCTSYATITAQDGSTFSDFSVLHGTFERVGGANNPSFPSNIDFILNGSQYISEYFYFGGCYVRFTINFDSDLSTGRLVCNTMGIDEYPIDFDGDTTNRPYALQYRFFVPVNACGNTDPNTEYILELK